MAEPQTDDLGFIPADDDLGFIPADDGASAQETSSLQAVVPFPGSQPEPAPRVSVPEQLAQREFEDRQRLAELTPKGEPNPKLDRFLDQPTSAAIMSPHPALEMEPMTADDVLKRFPKMSTGDAEIIAGIQRGLSGAWNFVASPAGIVSTPVAGMAGAPGAAGLAGKAVLGTFAAEAFLNQPEAINKTVEAVRSGDPGKIAQSVTELSINTLVAIGTGKGTIESVKAMPRQEIAAARASGMERSADALESVAIKAEPPSKPSISQPESGQAFGIVPPEATAIQKTIEFFKPPEPSAIPEIKIEHGAKMPRLQPYETEKLLASSPEGMARVPVLGALMDPRATAKTAPDAAIITRAYSVHKGKTFAALWGESQLRNKDLFKADKETGTIELTSGERGYMSDVIEAEIRDPGSQSITAEQRAWINNEWLPLLEEGTRMLKEEGVREVVTEEMTFEPGNDYFPRPAIGKRNRAEAKAKSSSGGRPGSQPFSEKERKYVSEFEGARPPREGEKKEQIEYDPDAISRGMKWILGVYRSVADHRLANDPALGGKAEVSVDALKNKYADQMKNMDAVERSEFESQLSSEAMYPIWGVRETTSVAPAFLGKIYPIETITALESAYRGERGVWTQRALNATAAAKAMMATADMSAPVIQGAAMMGRHPKLWAKTTANSYRALLDPNVTAKVLENPKYKQAAEEFSQAGGSLLQLEDFLAGKEPGQVATRIPGFGKVVEATGRAYGTFIDLAKLELWIAHTKVAERGDWGRIAESIENSLFLGRMEKIALNPSRSVFERLVAFAPAYYRGAAGLVATAFQKGKQGGIAREMLAGYAAAGLLATVGYLVATGEPWDEIEKRLDPTKGTFMKVPVESGDGKRVEVGVGNVITQIVRLLGQAAKFHSSDVPIDDTGVENNPYLRFLRGRSALVPSLGIELSTGRDYMGNRITAKESVARRFMPFALQAMFPREETPAGQRVMDTAFSFFGLNAFPESEYAAQLRHMDETVRAKSDKGFLDLPLTERAIAVKEFKSRPDYKKREPDVSDMERFVHINEQRRLSLRQKLPEETRKRLDDLGLDSGGYKSTVTLKGTDVPLSRKEQVRYEDLLAEEYERMVKELPDEIKTIAPEQRDEWWSKYRSRIHEVARKRLMVEIEEGGQDATP